MSAIRGHAPTVDASGLTSEYTAVHVRVVFFVVVVCLYATLHYYMDRRLVRDTHLSGRVRLAARVAVICLALSVPAAFIAMRVLEVDALAWPAYLWLGLAFYLILLLWLGDLSRLGYRLVNRWRRGPEIDHGRRELLSRVAAGTAIAGAVGIGALGIRNALAAVEVTEVPIVLERLAPSLDGFRIVQVTDLHVGGPIGRSYVEDIVARVNSGNPDLIAVTGDLVDGSPAMLRHAAAPLADLRAKHGVYFVTGNHEYYSGVDAWYAQVAEFGWTALHNTRVTIGDERGAFQLAGVPDLTGNQRGDGPDLKVALAGRDESLPLILLAHQPRMAFAASKHGVDLQLSGHTHGGQLWPFHYLVKLQQRGLLVGRETVGDTQVYICRGAGFWGPPVRVGADAEIATIILRSPS